MYTGAIVRALFAGLIAGAAIAPSNALADPQPQVLGKTIGEWSAKWWQWAFSIPAPENPMLDETGANCEQGQQGPVWFLAGVWGGGKATRSCIVPRGKHILFPIANSFWINSAKDNANNTEKDYRQFANDFLPPSIGGDLEATLDGYPIIFDPKTPIIRSQSPVFTASFPADNVITKITDPPVPASDLTGYPIVSDGFWVMLPPLSRGIHTLHFRAGQKDQYGFQDVTYNLTVGNR